MANTSKARRRMGRIYCTKHGRPLYLMPEAVAICLSGCRIDLRAKAPAKGSKE